MPPHAFAAVNEARIYRDLQNNHAAHILNRVLAGTYLTLLEEKDDWYRVETAGPGGWIRKADTTPSSDFLKIFFVDVGQGDSALIEAGNRYRVIIDGGPDNSLKNYLTRWQYKYLLDAGQKIHIHYIFISHFDADHYKGLISLIADDRFTFGHIYHPGILKYSGTHKPSFANTTLGKKIAWQGKHYLETYFSNLAILQSETTEGMQKLQQDFLQAVQKARAENRLGSCRRLDQSDGLVVDETVGANPFRIEVLGPVLEEVNGKSLFPWFADESHTINGHSLVLSLQFGTGRFLFGGDLNAAAEDHLMKHYGNLNPFGADVAKSCHHGSSDFTTGFMNKINPLASVISSGDNETYSHPRADAIGCAGKYSRNERPLVFSTELARSANLTSGTILYGLINLRSDGNRIFMAQMREAHSDANIWDAYEVK